MLLQCGEVVIDISEVTAAGSIAVLLTRSTALKRRLLLGVALVLLTRLVEYAGSDGGGCDRCVVGSVVPVLGESIPANAV